jgi:hypothetical protein
MDEILKKLAKIENGQLSIDITLKAQKETLDKHANLLMTQNETLLRNTLTVEEHHKRSLHLEKLQEKLQNEITPIKEHVTSVTAIFSFIKWTGITAAAILSTIGALTALTKLFGG